MNHIELHTEEQINDFLDNILPNIKSLSLGVVVQAVRNWPPEQSTRLLKYIENHSKKIKNK